MFELTKRVVAPLFCIAAAPSALAHETRPQSFAELRDDWVFEPGVVIPLALCAWLYVRGFRRLRRVSPQALGAVEAWSFAAGWLTLVVALVSPLHPWGSILFSAHMTQHELLMLVAAPLLVLGRPLIPFLWALPRSTAREVSRWTKFRCWRMTWVFLTAPFVAWLIHAFVLWSWHIPALFQATLDNEFIHAFQHICFLASALLFWWAVLHGRRRAMGFGAAVLYMFTTALHSGLLGALLTFAGRVWYPMYSNRTSTWGLSPLEDQQLGGLIMWIPAGVVYIVAGLILFAGWLHESGKRVVESAVRSGEKAWARPTPCTEGSPTRCAEDNARYNAVLLLITSSLLFCLTSCGPGKEDQRWAANLTGGDPARGRNAVQHYGCIACHTIDGLRSQALVGPPLTRMASRSYLAGNMENTAPNMIRWIQKPREIHIDTAMPDIGVTDSDARDIASYLYSYR